MKKTTIIALIVLIITPFVLLLSNSMRTRRQSNAINLTARHLQHLQPVTDVVFNNDSALLDSAGLCLRLVVSTRSDSTLCRVSYPKEMVQVTQKGGRLTIGLSPAGRKLVRERHRFLVNADLTKIDPDTIRNNDTLQIYLQADAHLRSVTGHTGNSIRFNTARLPQIKVSTSSPLEFCCGSSVGRLTTIGYPDVALFDSRVEQMEMHLHTDDGYSTTPLHGRLFHIGTLTVSRTGTVVIYQQQNIDHIIANPNDTSNVGLELRFPGIYHRYQLK